MDIRLLLEKKIRKYPGKVFTIVVNNDIVNCAKGYAKPKLAKVRYKKDRFGTELRIGYYIKTDAGNRLENVPEVESMLNSRLQETIIGDVDLLGYIPDIYNIEINLNTDFNIISIVTPAYKIARDISMKNETGMISGAINGKAIEVSTMMELYDWFQKYSIDAYHNVLKFILMRKLKEVRELKFYFLMDAFVPISVYASSNSFLFNPFMYLPKYKNEFEQSQMFKLGNNTKKSYCDLTIMFLTPKEICKCFDMNRFVKFNWEFFIEVLGGWFCNDMPNPNKVFYILVTDEELPSIITEEDYREHSWAKDNYARITTLENACRRYSRSLGVPDKKVREFVELMNKRILIQGSN